MITLDPNTGKAVKLPYDPAKNGRSLGDLMVELKVTSAPNEFIRKYALEVREWQTNKVLWTRPYPHGPPQAFPMPAGNEMVLTWGVDSDGAHEEMKQHPELKAQADALPKKGQGFLVEVVDKHTGSYRHGLVAGVRDWREGRYDERDAMTFGDFVLIGSEHESTSVYRLSTGARLGEVFGDALGFNTDAGLFCVSNRRNELVVYDAATARERKHFTYANHVRFAAFLPAKKQLVVLTADQKVHIINADELQPPSPATLTAAQTAH